MSKSLSFSSKFNASEVTEEGLIAGVSVITAGVEAIGHGLFTDLKTLESVRDVASQFKGGVKVRLGHVTGVERIIGAVSNFRIEGSQLKADLQLLATSPHYSHVREIIARQPETVGLSIAFAALVEEIDKRQFVRVTDLFAVDLVDMPAANPAGLFSSAPPAPTTFESAVLALAAGGMSRADSVRKVVSERPELHRAYLEKGGGPITEPPSNKPLGEIVANQMRTGKSKADALRFAIQHFPETYRAWRASGNTATL